MDDRPWPEQILSALSVTTWRLVKQSRARSDEAFASAMRALTPVLTRNESAQHPATALIALVHSLVLAIFFEGSEGSCLEITPCCLLNSEHRRHPECHYVARYPPGESPLNASWPASPTVPHA
jgi:hypothetical protein